MLDYCITNNIDFVCLTNKHKHLSPAWTRLECEKLLKHYDYVLYCDSDVLIKKDSKNIFDVINYNDEWDIMAAYNHIYYGSGVHVPVPRDFSFKKYVNSYCEKANLKNQDYTGDFYVCSGCVIYSKGFMKYFDLKLPEIDVSYKDQEALNYSIVSGKIKCTEIPQGFGNFFDENSYKDETYFVHFCDQGLLGREALIKMFLDGVPHEEIVTHKKNLKIRK